METGTAGPPYAAIARARRNGLPVRAGFAVFVALCAMAFTWQALPLAWLALFIAFQGLEDWVAAPLRSSPDEAVGPLRTYVFEALTFVNSFIFSALSVHVWYEGELPGKLFAMLIPAGALLHTAFKFDRGRWGLTPYWLPHLSFFLGLPLASGLLTPHGDVLGMSLVTVAAGIYLAHLLVAARQAAAAHEEMHAAKREAERATQAKSEFVAAISHEIRNPMNAVVAAGAQLRRTRLSQVQREHVEMLEWGAEVLIDLLNQVLDMAKIEAGRLDLQAEPLAVRDKTEAAVRLFQPKVAGRPVALVFDAGDAPEWIEADPLRFQQIALNLISNAVKFTEAGEVRVRLGTAPGGEKLLLEVQDTGCGMDEATAARVFESYRQADAAVARRHGGTGLGLSISRKLAELMGGSLSVSSRPGLGSTFRLELPLIVPELSSAPVSPSGLVVRAEGLEVLLAEDHEVNQRIVRLYLEPLGMRLTIVDDGAAAVRAAAERPFDVILLDMQMPVMGGVEAARRIRTGGPNAATPIVALTGNVMRQHRAEWEAVGVSALVAKPIEGEILAAELLAAVATTDETAQVA